MKEQANELLRVTRQMASGGCGVLAVLLSALFSALGPVFGILLV